MSAYTITSKVVQAFFAVLMTGVTLTLFLSFVPYASALYPA